MVDSSWWGHGCAYFRRSRDYGHYAANDPFNNSKSMGISNPSYKYKDIKPELRQRLRAEWNTPVRWPLYALLLLIVAATVPAVRTYYRERL